MIRSRARGALLLAALAVACSKPASAPADAAPLPACTLETALVPGVPGSPGHLLPSDRNPNGMSELAAVMRTMQADLEAARGAIARGAPLAEMSSRHRKIRCAWPTEPGERNAAFDAGAQAYLATVAALEKAPPAGRAAAFDATLDGCRGCHERVCSGVLAAIEALRMSKPAASPPQ